MTVFLDANVPMYLVGGDHPNKHRVRDLLDELIANNTRLVTDAEVYQEILHRYSALGRREAIEPAFKVLDELADEVFQVGHGEVSAAKTLVLEGAGAREAVHVATMRANDVARVMTFDRGFDRFEDLQRLA